MIAANLTSARPFSESAAAGSGCRLPSLPLAAGWPHPDWLSQKGREDAPALTRPAMAGWVPAVCTRPSRRSPTERPAKVAQRHRKLLRQGGRIRAVFGRSLPACGMHLRLWLVVARGLTQLVRLPIPWGETASSLDPRIHANGKHEASVSLPSAATTCRYRLRNPCRGRDYGRDWERNIV